MPKMWDLDQPTWTTAQQLSTFFERLRTKVDTVRSFPSSGESQRQEGGGTSDSGGSGEGESAGGGVEEVVKEQGVVVQEVSVLAPQRKGKTLEGMSVLGLLSVVTAIRKRPIVVAVLVVSILLTSVGTGVYFLWYLCTRLRHTMSVPPPSAVSSVSGDSVERPKQD